MRPVFHYLNRCSSQPFIWGTSDCSLFVADWVQAKTGKDPAEHLRKLYDSPLSLQKALREMGLDWIKDPVGVASDCMARADLARTDNPGVGDVGVIALPMGGGAVSAICTGDAWAAKAESGITTANAAGVRVLAAWRVE